MLLSMQLSPYSDTVDAGPYMVCFLAEVRVVLSIQNFWTAPGTSGLLFTECCGFFHSIIFTYASVSGPKFA
jgi:hypothetical protein